VPTPPTPLQDHHRLVALGDENIGENRLDPHAVIAAKARRLRSAPVTVIARHLSTDHVSRDGFMADIANTFPEFSTGTA
jgi:hypothetical protein